jgi:hypothetical protein
MAIGALLCWYLIGCIYLEENDVEEAINIATQALDVAQKPAFTTFTLKFTSTSFWLIVISSKMTLKW